MRTNVYKDQILTLLQKSHLMTIAEIHDTIPNVDYSTVFRNVEQLIKEKKIKQVLVGNKNVSYESANKNHNHFICNGCGQIETIEIKLNKKVLEKRTINDITIHGFCNHCN